MQSFKVKSKKKKLKIGDTGFVGSPSFQEKYLISLDASLIGTSVVIVEISDVGSYPIGVEGELDTNLFLHLAPNEFIPRTKLSEVIFEKV